MIMATVVIESPAQLFMTIWLFSYGEMLLFFFVSFLMLRERGKCGPFFFFCVEGVWLSSKGEALFVFFWLASAPSVSQNSPFSTLLARRFAVGNKFSGANFCFRLFVVVLCFLWRFA